MLQKNATALLTLIILALVSTTELMADEGRPVLSVRGLVKQPSSFTMRDLGNFQQSTVRLNEVSSDRTYHGSFIYRGVPLKALVEQCAVEKEESPFFKPIDLAIIVRTVDGKKAVLSWAEVMYHNPADTILALTADPVMPTKDCAGCHKSPSEYQRWRSPLDRRPGLPKLVLANDFFTDRCIENVSSIEITDLGITIPFDRNRKAEAPAFTISAGNGRAVTVSGLDGYSRTGHFARQQGDGKGYHGLREFEGAPLADILRKARIAPGFDSVLIATSPEGYRSLISAGELLNTPAGRAIMVADTMDGKAIDKMGKFNLVFPQELSADRWIKSLSKIEIISVPDTARLSIVGVGCGDTSLLTLEAVSAIGKADAFVCSDDIKNRFARYIAGRPVLYDPLVNLMYFYRKQNPRATKEEAKKEVARLRLENINRIKRALGEGKNVALLEYGDPTIYGSWTYWVYDHFKRTDIDIVPGVSAFNAANAMIGKNLAINGAVVIAVPDGIRRNERMIEGIAKNGDTLAVFVGIEEIDRILPVLKKYFSDDTPACIAYKAGFSKSGRLVPTTLGELKNAAERDTEKFLGVIYVGKELR